jgi:SAM-dependent methyltransferase
MASGTMKRGADFITDKIAAMRIAFVTMAPLTQGPAGPTSDLASARYRVLIPAQSLARLGHAVQLVTVPQGSSPPPQVRDLACDVLVLSKSYNPGNEQLILDLKARGVRVIADYCDDHFAHPQVGPHFRNVAMLADQVVAATEAMAAAVKEHTGREALVITDPVEGPRREPRFAPRLPRLHIAWFGSPTNIPDLIDRSPELNAVLERMPVRLTVVTQTSSRMRDFEQAFAAFDPARLQVELIPWSIEATWRALADADCIWIPFGAMEKNSVKSPNRLVESLWAGRVVVADALPSYAPFAEFTPIGQGLERGVMAALADPSGAERRIRAAQRYIARRHSGFEIGRLWAQAAGDGSECALRLNLGCGDKIVPGYVNVDVVEARAGMRPDVICDLHDLAPFADASADEILSVHVVEHFWRWEIASVLREWVRVLKPGGRMIVECPNIQSACQAFLDNPVENAHDDQRGQRTMWVFYGDPKWKDPLMIHRWGYTPESLRELLSEVGLRDVRQEPAQFKLREPRDMRVVGVKP